MAVNQGNAGFSIIAGATFAKGDLHKWIAVNSSGHAVIGPSTASGNIVGTLDSITATTAGAGVEAVSVIPLHGAPYKVFMAGSTRAAGQLVAASSLGYGIAPTTDQAALGVALVGSSGSTGRLFTVAPVAASVADV